MWVVVAIFSGGLSFPSAQSADSIAEIRVHGNHTTPDAIVLALAGLAVGDPASDERLKEAEEKLRASGRFDAAEVRRRLRSIADPSDILVILFVDERTAVSTTNLIPGPLARLRSAGMWLPIVGVRDGYGLTYGARFSFVDSLGKNGHVSVPITWGAERRAAVELERTFHRGPLTTAGGTLSLSRRVNPHFDLADTRREVKVQADRALTSWLRVGGDGRLSQVTFGATERRHTAAGAHLVLDTRLDPSFPRNAVHTIVGWERVAFRRPEGLRLPESSAGRLIADLRGYVGVVGSAVLALRAHASRADARLPPSEQSLLGGNESLRGYRAGHRAGDSLAALSAEVRLPMTSPLSYGRFGVKAFVDTGTTWNTGERLADQRFERGMGWGVYFGATAITAGADLAWPERGKPRVHVGFGVTF
jgi:outer membrane protein assembly factor BamA